MFIRTPQAPPTGGYAATAPAEAAGGWGADNGGGGGGDSWGYSANEVRSQRVWCRQEEMLCDSVEATASDL